MEGLDCWAVETSKDGERWRFFGKAWKMPNEAVLLHAVPRFVRFRRVGSESWSTPLERNGDHPMSLLQMEQGTRKDLWPERKHLGLPVLLPGGEAGRLVAFWRSPDGERWTYTLEFRGRREG